MDNNRNHVQLKKERPPNSSLEFILNGKWLHNSVGQAAVDLTVAEAAVKVEAGVAIYQLVLEWTS